MKIQRISIILFIGIFLVAAFFRLYGVNWDQGQHLHPDERFLTMVANGISWPKDFGEYMDTATSPLNPHNRGFGFFVYGTFPVFFTKWVADLLGKGDYGNLTIIGRQLSAMVDLGTVLLVFLICSTVIPTDPERSRGRVEGSLANARNSNKLRDSSTSLGMTIKNWAFPLLSMFFYSIMVLPIQLSHFYAVDTYLTFFITLSFYLLIVILNEVKDLNQKSQYPRFARFLATLGMTSHSILNSRFLILNSLLGIAFGLALASKISAILFLPIIGLGLLFNFIKRRNFFAFVVHCLFFTTALYITFRLAQPYAFANSNIFDFTLNPKIMDNWKQLEGFMKPDSGFPPSVQWFGITPYLFPLASLILWGLGLPLGIISILAVSYYVLRITYYVLKKKIYLILNTYYLILFLSLLWILILFIYQASQPAPTIRYFIPIYPFLAIIAGYSLFSFRRSHLRGGATSLGYLFICLLLIIYPLSFISIYSQPHSRVSASSWIYSHIPNGSTIATEHWDDGLPMTLDSQRISQLYNYVSLPLYDPDRPEKWIKIAKLLNESDYIVLTSNRLWGSITKAPELFPQASRYYRLLFNGSLGFKKIAEITSFPSLPIPLGNICVYLVPPGEEKLKLATGKQGIIRFDKCNLYDGITYQGIVIRDEISEETFTVYDHPKVIIFQKVKPLDYLKLLDDHNYKQ